MGLIEFQIRKEAFSAYVKAELNRRRLPSPMLNVPLLPELQGRLLERIECLDCIVKPSQGAGRVTVEANMVFHVHTSLATVRAAGSLQPAATEQIPRSLAIDFSIALTAANGQPSPPSLQWSLFSGLLSGGAISLDLPQEINAQAAAVEADHQIVAIRLGTRSDDPVNAPIIDRLGGGDWVRLITGDVLAEVFTANLATTLDGDLPPGVIEETAATGTWATVRVGFLPWNPPFVLATAGVVAENQCLFDIDVAIDLTMAVTFQVTGSSLVTTLTLAWDADSTLCDIVSSLIFTPIAGIAINVIAEDQVADAILGAASNPAGFQQVAASDSSITYQRTSSLNMPQPMFAFTQAEVTSDGLVTRGTLQIQANRQGLQGEATPPVSRLDRDCGARQVRVAFQPASVALRDIGVGGPPRLFAEGTTFDPPKAWVVTAGASNTWLDLVLEFTDPPTGRLAPGTPTSVFLHTDCGLRWVDLGVIPADRAQPTTADIVEMISDCMAISDPWGEGVLNLGWLIDPPDVLHGFDPIRQWSLGLRELPAGSRVDIVARAANGDTRIVGEIEGRPNVAIQVVTAATETLELRTNGLISAPAPIVVQGWVVPFAQASLDDVPVSVASVGSRIGYVGGDGETRLLDLGPNGELRASHEILATTRTGDASAARIGHVLNRESRGHRQITEVARIDRVTVAVIHNGQLLIGTQGPTIRL